MTAQQASPTPPSPQQQQHLQKTLRKLDFSTNAALKQATTTLRRVWLLDPPLSNDELADPATVHECFRAMCAAAIGTDDDHEAWVQHTPLALLPEPPVRAAAEPAERTSVLSVWREEVYEVYRHVFSDLWRALVAEVGEAAARRFDAARADAVSLVVLPAEEEGRKVVVERTAFTTDTFLYPVWVHPRARVGFAAAGGGGGSTEEEEELHVWAAREEATWRTGLWIRAGAEVVLTTKMGDGAAAGDESGVAAVFVTGHCDATGQEEEAREEATAAGGDTAAAPETGADS